MPAPDTIHDPVKNALVKDGSTITDDPYTIKYEEISTYVDLAAERLLAAERGEERIAVEIKSFVGHSRLHDLEVTLGQYHLYHALLQETAPERKLYLAVSDAVYNQFFTKKAVQLIVRRYQLSIIVVNLAKQEIVAWIK